MEVMLLQRNIMFTPYFVLCFLSIGVIISAVEIDREKIVEECAQITGLKEDDLEKWMLNQRDPSDDILCFMKCCHEKDGSLDKDGKWDTELLADHLKEMYVVKHSLKDEIMQCFSKIPPIKSCKDMKAASDCIPEIEFRNCSGEFDLSEKDFEDFEKNHENPSEKMLCYMKCSAENDDILYTNGTLNYQLLDELIDRDEDIDEKERNTVRDCLAKVPPVNDCTDFKPFHKCVYDI